MRRFAAALAAAGSLLVGPAHAQFTWTGNGVNNNISNPDNWGGTAPPANNDLTTLTFAGTNRLTPNQDAATFTAQSLAFAANAGAFNVGGNPFAFGSQGSPAVTNNSASNVAVSAAATFTAGGTLASAAGSLTLGPVTVVQGTLAFTTNNVTVGTVTMGNAAVPGGVVLNTGANTVRLAGNVVYNPADAATAPSRVNGTFDLNGGMRGIGGNGISNGSFYDIIVNATFVGTGGLTVTGSGPGASFIVFQTPFNYSGPTVVNNQAHTYLGNNNVIPVSSPVTLGPAAFLELRTTSDPGAGVPAADYSHAFHSLAGGDAATVVRFGATSTLTVGGGNTDFTYGGTFIQNGAGAPTLVKTGTGAWTLTGPIGGDAVTALSATVQVNQGALLANSPPGVVNGLANSSTGRGPVTVAAGATLGGSGAVVPQTAGQATNLVTVNGTLAPGATLGGVGTLQLGFDAGPVTALATVALNGTYAANVSGATSDLVTVVGALNLGGTSALNVVGALDGTTTYTIASYRTLAGTFATNNVPASYTINYGPGVTAGTIRLVPVPEPASVLGVCAAASLAGWRLRRRKTP